MPLGARALYKFEIRSSRGMIFLKTDPFGSAMELRPNTASKVTTSRHAFQDHVLRQIQVNGQIQLLPQIGQQFHRFENGFARA